MKATKYIAMIALLAGLVSCQPEWGLTDSATEGMVEVTFSVSYPEPIPMPTKAVMGEGPTSLSIYLCLFGPGDGYLQNWLPTTLVSTNTNSQGYITGGTFKVKLPITDERRVVHVIADPPGAGAPPAIDYLDNVMEHMVTSSKQGAYWQEIVLPTGISDDASAMATAIGNVQLVRNFAKVIVNAKTGAPFTVNRWALINVPDKGYVAPYNSDWRTDFGTNQRFPLGYLAVEDYANNTPPQTTLYKQLTENDEYMGYMPASATIDKSFPGDPASSSRYVAGGAAQYLYERPVPEDAGTQTAVLAEITFDSTADPAVAGHTYWYKIEILDDAGLYFPFLRDVMYKMEIQGLKVAGSATARAAFDGPYFGNISSSLETASLNELSNGTSIIHVDQMEFTFLTGGPHTLMTTEGTAAQFWFKPTASSPAYFKSTTGECDMRVELFPVEDYDPAVLSFTPNPGSTPDGTINVTLDSPAASLKKSIIRVSGRAGDDVADNPNKYLYREMTITVMTKQNLAHGSNETRVTNTPVTTSADNLVNISICLPEGLGADIFPVQLYIEAENNTLSARTADLPAATGPSMFDATRNTFYYIYTIDYSVYRTLDPDTQKYVYHCEFPITFYTNNRTDNSTAIKIHDPKGFFNDVDLSI